ncbi:MAG: Uma2 family endonuclease [Planctomycetes bacterium]|nr:Uma2 family endonuclease [Planctomycetota bacterium]MCW8134505.1 Uma2 family endonuclease [Planctomycetota bacterium]
MGIATDFPIRSKPGEPPWELATWYPKQGAWTKDQYLDLTDNRRGIEFNAGTLEFLPMGTEEHQLILKRLFLLLNTFVSERKLGEVLFAGIRVETAPEKVREPDLAFMGKQNASRRSNRLWHGADLVLEVVSPSSGDRKRDLEGKVAEYAQAGIPEYWIVDPVEERITVLALRDGKYVEHCVAEGAGIATSALLAGFGVESAKVFTAE